MRASEHSFCNINDMASFLRVLGNPTQLEILFNLLEEPCCVCELASRLGQRQPCISQHLMVLRQAGLVYSQHEGWQRKYFLASENLKHSLDHIHASWILSIEGKVPVGMEDDDEVLT